MLLVITLVDVPLIAAIVLIQRFQLTEHVGINAVTVG
jgi:hypothetical protein